MSSPAANDLNRILLGSTIGAAIGLVLLALGVAILWNAADQRLAPPVAEATPAPAVGDTRVPPTDAVASPTPYPTVAPAPSTPPVPVAVEPPRPAAPSPWGLIFDDGDDQAETAAPPVAPRAAPPAASPRPAPRPATPRRPPEAQRQDDSLFF